jgi:parallel beta-helix repeat protein
VDNFATLGPIGVGGPAGGGEPLAPPLGPAGPGPDGSAFSFGFGFGFSGIAGGAAYYDNDSDANITNCIFSGNSAYDMFTTFDLAFNLVDMPLYTMGGALYSVPDNTININNSDFIGNLGGAVYCETGCILDLDNCVFEENTEAAAGGAIYLAENGFADIVDCSFASNIAMGDGGAIMCDSDADFTRCSFAGNMAGGNGGAIDAYYEVIDPNIYNILELNFESCGFAGNKAVDGIYGFGGAVHIQDFEAQFNDCYFLDNTSRSGGGLFLTRGTVTMDGGIINGNKALGASGIDTSYVTQYNPLLVGGAPGAVIGDATSLFDMVGRFGVAHWIDLSASFSMGGGIVLADTHATLEDCVLQNNVAESVNGTGGAIILYGGNVDHLIKNCLLTDNSAEAEGGAIATAIHSTPRIQNCTFVNNSSDKFGSAVYSDWTTEVVISDSIFDNCNNTAIGEEYSGGDIVEHCLFNNNANGDYGIYDGNTGQIDIMSGTDPNVDPNGTNITGDPLFVTGPFGDYYLSQISTGQTLDSPAVDAGSTQALDLGMNTRTTRTDGVTDAGFVDIGYHYTSHIELEQFTLTSTVVDGHGTVEPFGGTYYRGMLVKLTADPDMGYHVRKWTGTGNDTVRRDVNNFVVMLGNRDVMVEFAQPRLILVGGDPNYTTIQRAIDEAEDGDTVVLPTGVYDPPYPGYPYPQITITIDKGITLRSTNPDKPSTVAATILDNVIFEIYTVGTEATIDGLTITHSRVHINFCSPTIRNCVFTENHWFGVDGPMVIGADGFNGVSVNGGAMTMYNSSPVVQNCIFRDCSVTGGNGGDGWTIPTGIGQDGGWAGWAYGGAAYIGYGSNPTFTDCEFVNCFALGGDGGNGGDGHPLLHGGRGGNYIWSPSEETGPFTFPNWWWWDGWLWGPYDAEGIPVYYGGYYKDYWKYSGYGGAVYIENDSNPKFHNCNFVNNTTYGGISGLGGFPLNTPDVQMTIENFGGAVYACYGSAPEFTKCNFTDNTADPTLDPAVYVGLFAPEDIFASYGGTIAAEDGAFVKLVDCNVMLGEATVGGGVYWSNAEMAIIKSDVSDNIAFYGGGLYSVEAAGEVKNSKITGNQAFVDTDIITNPTMAVPVMFGEGGGYHGLSSIIDITNSVFTQNWASASGGAIYLNGSDGENLDTSIIHNCLLTENSSGRDGGAISSNGFAEPIISNCTIADNNVSGSIDLGYGGGVSSSYESNVEIINTIIWGNCSYDGSQVAILAGANPGTVNISHSDIGPRYDPNVYLAFDVNDLFADPLVLTGGGAVLIDGQTIYDQFDAGQNSVKVIVTLVEPANLRAQTDWNSRQSVTALRAEIDRRQDVVLSSITSTEFTMEYRYDNVAAFSGGITLGGLNKLLNEPLVSHIEPVKELNWAMTQAIHLANAYEARQAFDGTGASVAICDSGFDYTHPMLGNGGFPNSKIIGGYDFGSNDPDPFHEGVAHGTCCAGIAAGSLGHHGDYIGGVAYNSHIYGLKISVGFGGPLTGAALAAWDWCITHRNDDPYHPIKAISNSWGGGIFNDPAAADASSPAFAVAADAAVAAGITVLAASGNNGFPGWGISWPAALSKVVSVGAVYDITDEVTGYSNTADILDILAPADPVYTPDIVGPGGYWPGDYFPLFNGTSSACPFAAGVVVSLQSAALEKLGHYLTPGQIKYLLIETGDLITDTKVNITKPRVNLGATIAALGCGPPIYIEQNCVLNGWEAPDTNSYWSWDSNSPWPDSNTIEEDPYFIYGYYLSQFATGQIYESNCVDGGSDLASILGMDAYTTRIDGVNDVNIVDMGYHYSRGVAVYELTVNVIGGNGTVQPDSGWYYDGAVVRLEAIPEPGYYLEGWYDVNDFLVSSNKRFDVVMDSNHVFNVTFRQPAKVAVSGGADALQDAIDAAGNGDKLILARGTYNGDINFRGKEIKLFSVKPDDPNVVAQTIIDCQQSGRAFTFNNLEDPNTVIDGLTIINGDLTNRPGGAIYIGAGSSPTIVNMIISDSNVTNAHGGAIYIEAGGSPILNNVNINNCSAIGGHGGGVYIGTDIGITLSYLTITNCAASGAGGAVYAVAGSSPTFVGCDFSSNSASLNGGGLFSGHGSTSVLRQSTLTDNTAGLNGGAIYYDMDCVAEVNNCTVSGNIVSEEGGGIFYGLSSSITVADCNISDNLATYGGAIYLDSECSGTIADSVFVLNDANEDGGAIYLSDSVEVEISDCSIGYNSALRGGGIHGVYCSDSTVIGCSITYNRAAEDAVFEFYNPDPNDPNLPLGPPDPNGSIGDANYIAIQQTGTAMIAQGGGIYSFEGPGLIADCNISYNTATTSGGGVYIAGEYSPWLKNCLITNNLAETDGAGVSANWQVNATISNCTIADNEVTQAPSYGGGLYVSYNSHVEVIDSIIWGNVGYHEGAQIAVATADVPYPLYSTVNITYSDIEPSPDPNVYVGPSELDIVFAIDTTGSMGVPITAVTNSMLQIIDQISARARDWRIGIVGYRDDPPSASPGSYLYYDYSPLTNNVTALINAVNAITLGGGSGAQEAVYSGLMHCVDPNALDTLLNAAGVGFMVDPASPGPFWRPLGPGVRRAIILMADIGPMHPEVNTNYVHGDVIAAANNESIDIFSVLVGSHFARTIRDEVLFTYLAEDTGGAYFEVVNANEVVDAILTAIRLIQAQRSNAIFVDNGCSVSGWDPNTETWDPNTNNIGVDPNFIAGYYLSQIAAAQSLDSPCVDAGSDDANDPNIGMHTYTTRTDGVNDVNIVDMGYHYREGLAQYVLTVTVVDANGDPCDPNFAPGYVDPNMAIVYEGYTNNVIDLTAYPDIGYKVKQWTGTDDDTSISRYNSVTMTGNKHVTIEFEQAPLSNLYLRVIYQGFWPNGTLEPNTPPVSYDPNFGAYQYYDGTEVTLIATPDPNYEVRYWFGTDDDSSKEPNNIITMDSNDRLVTVEFGMIGHNIINLYDENMVLDARSPFPTIQAAVDAAGNNYTVEPSRGVYSGPGNYDINLRAGLDPNDIRLITVRSTDPTDRDVVANTIIDCGGLGRAFIFDSGEDPNYIVSGLTIMNGVADIGGAMLIDGASPSIRNCIIADNTAVGDGGAMHLTNASPIIVNTEISRNSAGGFGGGIYAQTGSVPEIINCLISFNSSGDIGGAMYLWESDAIIRLCTIAYNTGLDYGDNYPYPNPKGGIAARDASPDISNCIIGRNGETFWMPGNVLFGMWGDAFSAGDDLYNCDATWSNIEEGGGTDSISEDPLWVTGGLGPFYLSQTRAGQPQTSPSMDAGEQYILQTLQTTYNLGNITTSIMNQTDSGWADQGYHYPFFTGPPIEYNLVMYVIGNGRLEYTYYDYTDINDYDVNAVIGPNETPAVVYVTPGTTIQLRAIPDPNYRVLRWTGTNDDSTFGLYNSITMYGNRYVIVEFERAVRRILDVSTDGRYTYLGVQDAIDDARDGDMVVLHSGTYPGTGFEVIGKNITITGTNPDDPAIVETTVIDCTNELNGGIHILGAPGGQSVLSGITIMNSVTTAISAPGPQGAGARGFDGSDNMPYARADMSGDIYTGDGYVNSSAALTVIGNHIITNCIIRDCSVTGGNGSNGNGGDPDQDGGDGGNGGFAGAAGIYIGDIFDYYYDYNLVYHPNYPNDANWAMYDYQEVVLNWGSSPLFKNCIIDNCVAIAGNGDNGGNGGDRATGGSGGVPGRAFGAGIYCDVGTSPTFENCTVTNCRAIGGNAGDGGNGGNPGVGGYGGLSYADPCQPDPEIFSAHGAGVFCGIGCKPTFVDCTISGNITDGSVSGVGGFSQPSNIQQQPRRNYNIPSYGAGLYCDSGCTSIFTGCGFQDNYTTYYGDLYTGYGGGVCLDGGKDYDYAFGYGFNYIIGPFSSSYYLSYLFDSNYVSTVLATLTDCQFSGNSASVGGGLYAIVSDVNIVDCNFADNTSFIGGGLCFNESLTVISDSIIQRNIVNEDVDPNTTFDPNDPNVIGVAFGAGGGIYSSETDTLIRNSEITNNFASGSGGGLYLFADANYESSDDQVLMNCLITDNVAGRDGGGISVNWQAWLSIYNCTIADNNVSEPNGYGGGLYSSYESSLEIMNSIIWGNSGNVGIKGSQIAVMNGDMPDMLSSSITVSYSDVQGWRDANDFGRIDANAVFIDPDIDANDFRHWDFNTVIDDNPLFVSGYYLSQIAAGQSSDSPCVDYGSTYASQITINDINEPNISLAQYTTRVDGVNDVSFVDLGYHYPIVLYRLTAYVVGGNGSIDFDPDGLWDIDPNSRWYNRNAAVTLNARPDPNYRVKGWYDINDVLVSINKSVDVVMNSDMVFKVQYELPNIVIVTGGGNAIQLAIDAAQSGDILIVVADTYEGDINLQGKDITLVSSNPDDPNVVAMTIIDGQLTGGRGFIFNSNEGPNTIIDGFTIVNGSITGQGGGAIYVDVNSSPTIMNVNIYNSTTDANGGAIYVDANSSPRFINCIISGCSAENGGAVHCDANSSPIFYHCTFINNSAVQVGGAMLCDPNVSITISDSNFLDNTASYGGALYCAQNSSGMIIDTILERNDANQDGGAIYLAEANDLSITDCNISYNTSEYGAGLYSLGSLNLKIIGSSFNFNQAPLVFVDPNDPNTLSFGQGGGMYCGNTEALIKDCVLNHNSANTSGGGIYLTGESDYIEIVNCLIINNLAGRDGGGISANWHAEPNIANCSFISNAAPGTFGIPVASSGFGGGLYCSYHSNVEVIDSIFWNNFALNGFEIAVATGFRFDPRTATLMISYSDIKRTALAVLIDTGCTLWDPTDPSKQTALDVSEPNIIWDPVTNNIDDDPLFVAGPLGDYYLSHFGAGQTEDSLCMDAGSALAIDLDMIKYTTRTDELPDTRMVDMGYHYPLRKEECRFCDLYRDGIINFMDFATFAANWLDEGCFNHDGGCEGADFTLDTYVDFNDLAFFVDCWLVQDVCAPMPNPSEWRIVPHLTSVTHPFSIGMTVKTSYDAWSWPVQYYFQCVYGAGHDSGWQDGTTYEDTGLDIDIYGYRVKARDGLGNETEWSIVAYTGTGDTTPPAPVPAIISIQAVSPNSISMTSQIVYDDSGVQYYFESTTPGGHDSGWQNEPNYTDVNLIPDTTYCYRVMARDTSTNYNITIWSPQVCTSTPLPPDTLPPFPDPMQWDDQPDANGYVGLPREVLLDPFGNFDYGATMRAILATDLAPAGVPIAEVEYYFECQNDSAFDSGWRTAALYPNIDDRRTYTVKIGGSGHSHIFRVKARDASDNLNETDWSVWYPAWHRPTPP